MDQIDTPLRHALVLARREMEEVGAPKTGTEHMLLAILGEPRGLAFTVLVSFDVTLSAARTVVRTMMSRPTEKTGPMRRWTAPPSLAAVGLPRRDAGSESVTTRLRQALKRAAHVAIQIGDQAIGTEHLLLAILELGEAGALTVLQMMGKDLVEIEDRLTDILVEREKSNRASDAERKSGDS